MRIERSVAWVWWICGILFFASVINYMDRLALSNNSPAISKHLEFNDEQYGRLELAFGCAFAFGAIVFGFFADNLPIRWLYPAVLLLWSIMGFLTGWARTYEELALCRLLLGFFEGGHWPCALRTTQRLLAPNLRTLGNSILQSGLAFGAIITPIVIWAMNDGTPGAWRPVFRIVGSLGLVWVVFWLLSVGKGDVDSPVQDAAKNDEPPVSRLDLVRKYLALILIVVSINICWHTFRVWNAKFLETGRGYENATALWLIAGFNIFSDAGCLTVGFATAYLARRGLSIHGSRVLVFVAFAFIALAGAAIPLFGPGPSLLAVWLVAGFGAAGMFPCYYAFSQELTRKHQGKVTGTLGAFAWLFPSLWHWRMGAHADVTHSYDVGMAIACTVPLVGAAALLLVWPRRRQHAMSSVAPASSDEDLAHAVIPAERVTGVR